jgi:hypothetical protein
MASERTLKRFRRTYAALLRLFPKSYRDRFGEPMAQTFHDLLRDRATERRGLLGFALLIFAETFAGILREHAAVTFMRNKNLVRIAVGTALLLGIPLVLTLLGDGVDGQGWHWTPSDFVFAFILIFGTGATFELISRKGGTLAYRAAVGIALAGAFLVVWINAAVGIIGEPGGINVMYFGVLAVGIIGACVTRLQPQGMSRALFAMAAAQMLVPIIALMVATSQVTREPPGLTGIFILNAVFATVFSISALLFRRASRSNPI